MNTRMSLFNLFVSAMALCVMLTTVPAFGEDGDSLLTPAPGGYRILSPDSVISFPFEVFQGDIFFRGGINGREVRLLLDDGFMWDQLLFWGSPLVDSLGLTYDGDVSIGETDEPGAISSRTASNITLKFPGVEFFDQTAVVAPYSSGVSTMWSGSEGQVSCTFFKHFVVDINFDSMKITLIPPDKFAYRGSGAEIPWRPMGFGPWSIPITLDLADGRRETLEAMMDLGYNDQLQIASDREHHILPPEHTQPISMGFNIHRQETRGLIGRVAKVSIGGYDVEDVLAGFIVPEDGDNAYHEVMIGLGLLSRFNLIFDYSRRRMFVEPNHTWGDPFEYNMSGIVTGRGDGDYLLIKSLIPGSPAAEAGLKVGDKITALNGRPATSYTFWEWGPIMRQAGATVTLTVLREGGVVDVSFVLRRLL